MRQQKSPTRHPGASGIALSREERGPLRHGRVGIALSREERGPLRHGRVAWLTAFQPITVAGPRPIHTAFPASPACKLKFECKPRLVECQCTTENGTIECEVTESAADV